MNAHATTTQKIKVGRLTMQRATAIGLLVTTIENAHHMGREPEGQEFLGLGFTPQQIDDMKPLAEARILANPPRATLSERIAP